MEPMIKDIFYLNLYQQYLKDIIIVKKNLLLGIRTFYQIHPLFNPIIAKNPINAISDAVPIIDIVQSNLDNTCIPLFLLIPSLLLCDIL